MLESSGDAILDAVLEPLATVMRKRDVVEVQAIRPGELIIIVDGKADLHERVQALSADRWDRIFHALANKAGQEYDPIRQPRVSAKLPGNHRFEGMMGKMVGSGLSVTIRMHRKITRTLADFGLTGAAAEQVRAAIAVGSNIIISGGTNSGKTSLLNIVLPMIPAAERVLTLEDTRELFPPHKNQVNYVVSRNERDPVVGYGEAFDHLLRSTPGRVILGELSLVNAFPAIGLLNTGHRGFLATMHANSARLALDKGFYQRIAWSGHDVEPKFVSDYLRETVDLVIQVAKVGPGERRVTELWWPGEDRRIPVQSLEAAA